MRWAGHVARMGRQEMHTKFLFGNLFENVHFMIGKEMGGEDRRYMELA
jgi:hypothetical protein